MDKVRTSLSSLSFCMSICFQGARGEGRTGKWALFVLPLITILREGMEAIVFVGGVSLGQSAESIPIAAIVGIACGLICGYIIYSFASRASKYRSRFQCFLAECPILSSPYGLPRCDDELSFAHRRRPIQQGRLGLSRKCIQPSVRPFLC